jgi:predicted component of type VI protein secretion system
MAYLRVKFGSVEIERRDLFAPLVIGRSGECDVAVRDVLLSRRHCRIECAAGERWRAVDLGSKNGTTLNDQPLAAAVSLSDRDELRLGRVTVRFGAGSLADAGLTPLKAAALRPADPTEAMSATFAGFAFLEPGESPSISNRPSPRPAPRPPAAYQREDMYRFLSTIVSSSWDSIYAEAKRPAPTSAASAARMELPPRPRFRPRSPLDLSVEDLARMQPTRARTSKIRARMHRPRMYRMGRRPRWAGALTWMVVLLALLSKGALDGRTPMTPRPAVAAAAVSTVAAASPDAPAIAWEAGSAILPLLL